MKDMKKRIVALILTVVMSLLTLASCGSFDFVEEDLSSYASFDEAKFMEALKKLEIEDGEFTTNSETRELVLAATIYNAILDKLIAQTDKDDWKYEGKLGAGDVLHFVYYATDADGNVYFGSDMNESTITGSSTKANHVLRLDDYLEGDGEELLKLIAEAVKNADVDVKDYVYSMLTKSELETEAEKKLKEEKPDATADEIKAAKENAVKIQAGDKVYISYVRSYNKFIDGANTAVKEKATYELIELDPENDFHKYLLAEDTTATIGGGNVTAKNPMVVTIDDIDYTYSEVKLLWKVDSIGEPLVKVEYAPYKDIEAEKKEVTPDSLYSTTTKVDLKDKTLTYHIFPVYYISAPQYEDISGADILYYLNGSSLNADSYEAFDNDYKNGSEKLEDLLKDVKSIFATTEKDNKFYAEGTELAKLLKAYNDLGGANPTTEQKTANAEAKTALTDAQNAELKKVVDKIAAATFDGKTLGDVVRDEYKKSTQHSLKESYDSDIITKVRTAIYDLIFKSDDYVKVTSYPEKLVKEFVEHIYESYEYTYYTGDFDKNTSNVKKYATFEDYLVATLKVSGVDKIDGAIEKEAKTAITPIIKIYVVSKALEAEAVKAMNGPNGYVEADITGGAYKIDEQSYRDYYGDEADKKIAEALKDAKEREESAREEAGMFLIDKAYMRRYKREVGASFYRQQIEAYGEINLRTAMQFNKLFYYLTCTNIEFVEDEGHVEIKYTEDGTKIDFRTVDYTIKAD